MNKDFWKETFITTFFLFAIEVIFRVVSFFEILDWATFRIFLSCLILVLILEILVTFFSKKRVREMVMGFLLFVATCYAWVQVGLRNFLGVYISLGTSSQMNAVASYIKEFLSSYKIEYYFILLPFIIYLIYMKLPKKWGKNRSKKIHWQSNFSAIIFIVILASIYVGTLFWPFMQNSIQIVPNSTLFFSPVNSSVAVNQFGTSVFGILDIKQLLFPKHILESDFGNKEEETEPTRTFDDTNWEELIYQEKNLVLNNLNKYFISRKISNVNDYTGYFEDKNVIVIMLESVNDILLKEEYYPNFNKILQNAWYWENNYSPRSSCATGDNEFSGMTSLYALNTSCTTNTYPENTYFTSIFNRFLDKGYNTSSFHDLDSTYYNRDVFHLNMGSQVYYDGKDLGLEFDSSNYIEWPSDVEFIEKASEIFMEEEPFMVWLTTVTAHQPYDYSSELGDKYLELFADTDYSLALKRYMSKLKVTDDALGTLLETLEDNKILDDTVIVLYGDHYPYGLSDSDVQSAVSYDIEEFYEIERVPFVIYNSELTSQVFSEKTTYMNILPTLANLFNLDYDARFYLGEDLFSEDYSNRIIFADSSWEDSLARYDAGSGKVIYFGNEKYTTEELREINQEIHLKKQMSKLAITNNYFDYLEKALEEIEKTKEEAQEEKDD